MVSVVGLIGHPVAHSVSPAFQQAAFDALGLPWHYEAWDTPPDALAATVASLRSGERQGANVTVPHKEAVLPLLDRLSEEAKATGAVNTIVRVDGRLVGHNTDIEGFSAALREDGGFDVRNTRALVLGAGGAARAVVYALLRDGAARVLVHNRTPWRADALVASMAAKPGRLATLLGDLDQLERLTQLDLIVNTTTLGMAHGPAADEAPLTKQQIPARTFVFDIVANPAVTPLLARARARRCRTLGGLPMLVRQGAAAFERWTGERAPLDVMMAAARRAMGQPEEADGGAGL
jgi:shikimate dehydrogenase